MSAFLYQRLVLVTASEVCVAFWQKEMARDS